MNYIQRNKKFLSVYLVWVFSWFDVVFYYWYINNPYDYLSVFIYYNVLLIPLLIYFLYQSFKKPKK